VAGRPRAARPENLLFSRGCSWTIDACQVV